MTKKEKVEPTPTQLKEEVERLKDVIKELTSALKLLTEKDERAKRFIDRVESLLGDAEELTVLVDERDAAIDALHIAHKDTD